MSLERGNVVDAGVVVLAVIPVKVFCEVSDGLAVVQELTRVVTQIDHRTAGRCSCTVDHPRIHSNADHQCDKENDRANHEGANGGGDANKNRMEVHSGR